MRIGLGCALALAWLAGSASASSAQTASAFYKGRIVRLIVGTESVGSYDTVARALSVYLPRHMPGAPTFVVENMPGASAAKATQYIQLAAPADGTAFGFVQPYILLNKLLHPELGFDPMKLTWVARLAQLSQIGFVWRTSPARSVDETVTKAITFGAGGATGPAAMVPWTLDRMLGAKIHVVMGYASDAALLMAMEQGELQGMGSASWSTIANRPDWIASKAVQPIYAISLKRLPQTPQTPALPEFTHTARDRAVAEILATPPTVGVSMIAPPGAPADRIALMRAAIEATARDPDFIAMVAKAELNIDYLSGDAVTDLVAKTMQVSADVREALNEDTAPIR